MLNLLSLNLILDLVPMISIKAKGYTKIKILVTAFKNSGHKGVGLNGEIVIN